MHPSGRVETHSPSPALDRGTSGQEAPLGTDVSALQWKVTQHAWLWGHQVPLAHRLATPTLGHRGSKAAPAGSLGPQDPRTSLQEGAAAAAGPALWPLPTQLRGASCGGQEVGGPEPGEAGGPRPVPTSCAHLEMDSASPGHRLLTLTRGTGHSRASAVPLSRPAQLSAVPLLPRRCRLSVPEATTLRQLFLWLNWTCLRARTTLAMSMAARGPVPVCRQLLAARGPQAPLGVTFWPSLR